MRCDTAKVSVIMPCFNAGTFVTEALQSVLNTGYPDIEIVVVDDGSTDDSVSAVRTFESQHGGARMRVCTHPDGRNRGTAASRNLGIREAKGKYICFLDADDTYFPNRFRTAIAILDDCREVDAVCEPFTYIYGGGARSEAIRKAAGKRGDTTEGKPFLADSDLFDPFLKGTLKLHITSFTVRKEVAGAVGGFPVGIKYTEDRAFLMKVISRGATRYGGNDPVSGYRIHDVSLCSAAENTSEFAFAPIRAMLHAYRWIRNSGRDAGKLDCLGRRIESKFYHFCARLPGLERTGITAEMRYAAEVARRYPSILARPPFWKTMLKLVAVEAGISKPWAGAS